MCLCGSKRVLRVRASFLSNSPILEADNSYKQYLKIDGLIKEHFIFDVSYLNNSFKNCIKNTYILTVS